MTFAREVLPAERQATSGRHRPGRPAGPSSAVQQLGTIVRQSLAGEAHRGRPPAAQAPRARHRRPRGAGEAAGSRAPELEAPRRGGAHPGLRAQAAALRQGLAEAYRQVRRGRQAGLRRAKLRAAGLHARAVPQAGVQVAERADHNSGWSTPRGGCGTCSVGTRQQGAGARGGRAAAAGAGRSRSRRRSSTRHPDLLQTDEPPMDYWGHCGCGGQPARDAAPAKRALLREPTRWGRSTRTTPTTGARASGRGHRRSARAHHPRQLGARPRRHRRGVGRRDEAGGKLEFKRVWDNKFLVGEDGGKTKLPVRVKLEWVVAEGAPGHLAARKLQGGQPAQLVRELARDPRAHELGHQLGLLDEKMDPKFPNRKDAKSPGAFQDNSVMGDYMRRAWTRPRSSCATARRSSTR